VRQKGGSSIDFIEILRIPRNYIEQSATQQRLGFYERSTSPTEAKLERFLAALMYTGAPFGFRISVTDSRARLHLLTKSGLCSPETVVSAFAAQFPDFQLARSTVPKPGFRDSTVHAAKILGVPKPAANSLNGLTEILTRSECSSIYQVWASPLRPSRASRYLSRLKYKSALERSQKHDAIPTQLRGQETRIRYDVDALGSSKRLEAAFRRMSADILLECRVLLAVYGGQTAQATFSSALNALLGTLSADDRRERLKVKIISGRKAQIAASDADGLGNRGMSTLLLPSEVVPYFEIPNIELGIKHSSPASFSTYTTSSALQTSINAASLFRSGKIALGYVYRHSSPDQHLVKYLEPEHLRNHTAIMGMTGTGKSTTKNRIVIDTWTNGVPSLLIEPVKTDARILMGAIPELRLFTLGQESVAPFRLNPFLIEDGVPVQLHINLLYSCFLAAWPLYGMLANHIRRIITRTYLNNGWDPVTNKRGSPISLDTFRNEAVLYCDEVLMYGSDLTQDFRGAIIARAEDLCDPARAVIFNTTENLPVSELLSQPTIIELKHLGDPEFTAFVLSLILVLVYEHFDRLGPSDRLRNLLVIDEAHRVLEELPKTLDISEAAVARRQVIDQLVNLIAEARSLGLGVILADQIPTRLARDALKNCHTKIVHRLTSAEDRQLMALETGCNEEQSRHIPELEVGEVVISDPSNPAPSNVQILNDADFHPEMKNKWTDEDVRERMGPFYESHPDFARRPNIPSFHIQTVPIRSPETKPVSLTIRADEIVQTKSFRDLYLETVALSEEDPAGRHVERFIAHYAVHLPHLGATAKELAATLLDLANVAYGSPAVPLDWNVVERMIADTSELGPDGTRRALDAP